MKVVSVAAALAATAAGIALLVHGLDYWEGGSQVFGVLAGLVLSVAGMAVLSAVIVMFLCGVGPAEMEDLLWGGGHLMLKWRIWPSETTSASGFGARRVDGVTEFLNSASFE